MRLSFISAIFSSDKTQVAHFRGDEDIGVQIKLPEHILNEIRAIVTQYAETQRSKVIDVVETLGTPQLEVPKSLSIEARDDIPF